MYTHRSFYCVLRAFNRFLQRKYRNMLVNLLPWCLLVSISACMKPASPVLLLYGLKIYKTSVISLQRGQLYNYIYFFSPGCACLSLSYIHACVITDMHARDRTNGVSIVERLPYFIY